MAIIDDFDKEILKVVQRNCRVPSELIAEQVGLSASAVQRRLKKLRQEGVIRRETAIVEPDTFPETITFVTSVEIDRDNYTALKQFNQWAQSEERIQQSFYVTGDFDLVLIIKANSTKLYDQLIQSMMDKHPNIKRVNTQVVLDVPKQSLELPL
ncbi:Lrp/AsnC family transcriptional regulator [Vibrio salinus]|uniref:Lrp/AsnC family transcriptional regulator n=1 Tax=Vibrio salinus TaxID=2899784 RepID=UPI001E2A278E|nr:Lrp/AsnC family transcriptional regulator [Vibrio salinus]MCE0492724.1 Lrp/AsnC family transcriptional regulator [Vibrio salinus]